MQGFDPEQVSCLMLYFIFLMMAALVMLLGLVLMLAHKLNKALSKLNDISDNAAKFVKMGVHFFKTKK